MQERVLILDRERIQRKLRRMAYQVWEHNSQETAITVIGIVGSGMVVAHRIAALLSEISPLQVQVRELAINKKQLLAPLSVPNIKGTSVVLVDDVVNSGKTLLYALKPILDFEPKKILTAVLVDRKHKLFPVAADIIGHSVATTIQDHIEVVTESDTIIAAYLQ